MDEDKKSDAQAISHPVSPQFHPVPHIIPRTYEGKLYYSVEEVAKIIGVTRMAVVKWNQKGIFTADIKTHDGYFLYDVERVMQLKSVYHPNWTRGGYQPSPTTSEPELVKEVPNDHQIRGKKQFKKISAATLETINRLSPDELETNGIIQSARVSGYICPLCSSGDGSHGTGMTQNPKIENHTSLHCFGCGKSFNPLQLCTLHYGLEIRRDFPALVEKICADFNIPLEYENFAFHSSFRGSLRKPRKLPPLDPKELKNIQTDLNASVEPLKTFMKYQPDQKWRGFDLEFLLAHGCRLINDWFAPSLRDTNQQPSTPTSRMIIPSGEASYLARLIDQA